MFEIKLTPEAKDDLRFLRKAESYQTKETACNHLKLWALCYTNPFLTVEPKIITANHYLSWLK